MVETLRPAYLTIGIEINLFHEACDGVDPSAYDALMDVYNDAYAEALAVDPRLAVFPSFQIDFIADVGTEGECFGIDPTPCIDRNLARSARMRRDRFALSTYPHLLDVPVDLPSYPDAVLARVPGERIVVAETGYPSVPLEVNLGSPEAPDCFLAVDFSPSRQRAYFDALVDAARRWDMEFVTWWSNRDLFPEAAIRCPCQDTRGFCPILEEFRRLAGPFFGEILFKAFASMGVRRFDGAPRPVLERWRQVRAEEAAGD